MGLNLRIIDIPFDDHCLMLYIGKESRDSFRSQIHLKYPEWEDDKEVDGMHYKNHVFIEDIENKNVLLHEISHYLEWLCTHLSCDSESEFKACLFSHVIRSVFKWD